jgi:NAD(P)-dependent dehydrogenase (short-subunit alcohol dehydrogenase family)
MKQNSGPVAIVTGATTGIGLATANLLGREGYTVYGTSRRPESGSQNGMAMLPCDVTSDESVASVIAEVLRRSGRIDVIVNNAGFGVIAGAEESSIEQVKALFEVNVFGAMRMTNHVLPVMRRQRNGRVINISSVLGFVPGLYYAIYSATKHAIDGYSQSLDHEVRGFGIRVIAVEPAITRTSFEKNLMAPDKPLEVYSAARNSIIEVSRRMVDQGDEPEVVARVVLKAARDPKPRLRYPAGPAARQLALLRRILPERMLNNILR